MNITPTALWCDACQGWGDHQAPDHVIAVAGREEETEAPDDPTAIQALTDLRDRCQKAVDQLDDLADDDAPADRIDRLRHKASGVKLALSYIDETIRGLDQ
jgi:hypothetical protein